MESARYLVQAVVFEHRSVREMAAQHGVSKTWLHEVVARDWATGEIGLDLRSKRPLRSPTRIEVSVDDETVELRKHLADEGFDAGALTIEAHLRRRHGGLARIGPLDPASG